MQRVCSDCGAVKEVKGNRLPRDWHKRRSDQKAFCKTCWHAHYILRTITFPVIKPLDGDWARANEALNYSWARSTALANWATTHLYTNDTVRLPSQEKCPKQPALYIYGAASANFGGWGEWAGAYGAASALLRGVELKYRAARYEVLWLRKRSLSSFKYPYPFPVRAEDYQMEFVDERPVIRFNLLGGYKAEFVLKGGPQMYRQLEAFKDVVSGAAEKCEAAVYRRSASSGDHRSGGEVTGHGPPTKKTRNMVKIVMWLPRKHGLRNGVKTYKLSSVSDAFLVADDGWRFNSDFIRTSIANHAIFLQRISEDTKHEKRWPKRKLANINAFRAARCLRQNNRLKTFCQQVAAMIAGRASRRGYDVVELDTSNREYIPEGFPWSDFKIALASALAGKGITLIADEEPVDNEEAGGEDEPPEAPPAE